MTSPPPARAERHGDVTAGPFRGWSDGALDFYRERHEPGVMRSYEPTPWLGTPEAATRIVDLWRHGSAMNGWLAGHVGPSTAPPPHPR